MNEVVTLRCQCCGGKDVEKGVNGLGKCNHCGSLMLLPRNEEIISLLDSAQIYRETHKYDLAIKTYEYVLERDPNELSAYEGILLSEYGIEYVSDTYSNKYIPTCHRAHNKNIYENNYYKMLIELADDGQKELIEKKANEINLLQQRIERQMANEESFEIFISFKAQTVEGEKTEDSLIARMIYDELIKKNYKVFFSEKTLENRIGSEYEPIIFKALHTSKVFILVGTSKENIESAWVRNEWSRFIERIKNNEENLNSTCFIPVFKDMNPYDMPKVNNQFIQGVDASKIGYVYNIVDGVEKMLSPESEKQILSTFDNVENMLEFEKIRKRRTEELKAEDWKDLQRAEDRKKEKQMYNWFLRIPYIMLFSSLAMTLYPGTWFVSNVTFYIWIILLIATLISVVAIPMIHKLRYPIDVKKMIKIPALMYLSLFVIFVVGLTCIPITINNEAAINFTNNRQYSMDFVYYSTFDNTEDDAWNVVRFTQVGKIKYTEKKGNKKFLKLPNTYRGNKLSYGSLELPMDIEGLIIEGDGKTQVSLSALGVSEIYAYNVKEIFIGETEGLTIYYSGIKPNCYACSNFVKID